MAKSITCSKSKSSRTGLKKTCNTCDTCNTCFTSGYTLVEILVGLTIIGLLFGFGFVNFRDFSRRSALSGAIKSVQGDLRVAQQAALSGQKPKNPFCDDPNILNSYNFMVYSVSEYKLEAVCSGGVVSTKDVILPSDVLIANPVPNPIQFKVLGQGTNIPTGSDATITLTQIGTNNTASTKVSTGGEIR